MTMKYEERKNYDAKFKVFFNSLTDDTNGFITLKKPFLMDYPLITDHVSGTNENYMVTITQQILPGRPYN